MGVGQSGDPVGELLVEIGRRHEIAARHERGLKPAMMAFHKLLRLRVTRLRQHDPGVCQIICVRGGAPY